jgi:hypothetical protein
MSRLLAPALALLLLVLAGPVAGQSTDATSGTVGLLAAGDSVEVGEPLVLTLDLPDSGAFREVRASLPPAQAGLAVLGEPRFEDGRWTVPARFLQSGAVELGPLRLSLTPTVGDRITSESAAARIEVLAPGVAPSTPADYLPPREAPVNWLRVVLLAGLGFLLLGLVAALALLLIRRVLGRPKGVAPALPDVPPLEEARRGLARLETLEIFRAHGTHRHYEELSAVLRRYIERRYECPALEMTEDELAEHLRQAFVAHPAATALLETLDRASLGKFAKWQASEDHARRDVAALAAFLRVEEEREHARGVDAANGGRGRAVA